MQDSSRLVKLRVCRRMTASAFLSVIGLLMDSEKVADAGRAGAADLCQSVSRADAILRHCTWGPAAIPGRAVMNSVLRSGLVKSAQVRSHRLFCCFLRHGSPERA